MQQNNKEEGNTLVKKGIIVGIGWAILGAIVATIGREHSYVVIVTVIGGVIVTYLYVTSIASKIIFPSEEFICLYSPEKILSKIVELLDKMDAGMGVVRMMPVEITLEMFEGSRIPSINRKVQRFSAKMKTTADELPYDWTIYGSQETFKNEKLSQATRKFVEQIWFEEKIPTNSWFAIDHNLGYVSLWFFGRASGPNGLDEWTYGLLIFFDKLKKLPQTGVYTTNRVLLRKLYKDLCEPFFATEKFFDSDKAREENERLLNRICFKDKTKK